MNYANEVAVVAFSDQAQQPVTHRAQVPGSAAAAAVSLLPMVRSRRFIWAIYKISIQKVYLTEAQRPYLSVSTIERLDLLLLVVYD